MPNLVRIANFLGNSLRRLHYSREDLRLFQEKRLKAVINYAYNFVPFYSRKLKAAGIDLAILAGLKILLNFQSLERTN